MRMRFGLLAAMLVVAAIVCVTALAGSQASPGRHEDEVRHRRDVPAQRAGGVLRADPGRNEGLLHVHQHAPRSGSQARRRRQADRVEVLRRRVQPGEHGAADAEARRGGQGLRHLRRPRHRASAGRGRLHERAQGAAAARLDGCDGVRRQVPASGPYTIGWQPDYFAEGRIYGKYAAQNWPNKKIGVLYQNDDYGKNYLEGLKSRPRVEVVEHRQRGRASAPPTRASRAQVVALTAVRTPTWSRSLRRRARPSRPSRR